ncbi:DUF4145 domain-containing protein [Litchfieldella rifensis]|uniref:DUF4145 domain-containing protein n=1 Tax=Litchfieldella rifensis TaxID=762643 RepID=A0ABV7LIR2_9GAMM
MVLIERNTELRVDLDDEGHAIGSSGAVWVLYECQGCENVVLRRRFWHTDMERGESEEESCYNTWYPPLISRQIPEWHKELPDAERRLISEVYVALHAKALSLTTMGLRALLDMYIVRKIGDVGTFNEKLEKLQQGGFLSAAQLKQLDTALDAGNAAAHRGFCPPEETVAFALDVVEVLLHQDHLGHKSKKVSSGIPKREKR